MFEIYYTSAPEGLKRGSSGFCTVAATDGIPKPVLERLEALSGYRHHFPQGQGQTNPVSHAHWRLSAGGKEYHVLSRVSDSGVDHTHRTNFFAHHIALDAGELPGAGPAAMLADKRVMASVWDGRVGAIARAALPMVSEPHAGPCNTWANVADKAEYAGLLLEAAIKTPNKPVCVIFNPGQPILPLIDEVLALLPAPLRWAMTFNSYFTSMPSSAICNWRFVIAKTPAADAAARAASAGIILNLADLSKLPALPQNQFTAAAKSGAPVQAAASTATAARSVAKKPMAAAAKAAPPKEELELRDEVDAAVANFGAQVPQQEQTSNAPIDLGFDPRAEEVPSLERTPQMEDQAQGYMSASRTAPIRNVEKLLDHGNSQAAKAQRRRRNQLILMACLGVVAIGVVGALVTMAMRGGDDTQLPVVKPRVEKPPEPEPEPVQPPPQVVVQPETKPETKPIIVDTRPVTPETKPVPVPVKTARVIVTPVQLDDPRSKIDIRNIAASTEYAQLFQFANDDADDLKKTASLALLFPGDTLDYKYETSTFSGSFNFEVNTANRNPSITVQWKDKLALGSPVKLCIMTYTKSQNQLQVIWPSGVTTKYTEIASTAYWILTQSTLLSVDASGNKEKGQKLAFRPYVVPTITLDSESVVPFKPPTEFPPGTQAALTANFPKGWTGTMFTEWDTKDPSQQTQDNMMWTAKMRFATSSPVIDAFFAITVRPKISGFSTNAFSRVTTDTADLAAAQKELDDINRELENIQDLATPELERRQKNLDLYLAKQKNYKAEGLTEGQAEENVRLAKQSLADSQKRLAEKMAPYTTKKAEKELIVLPQREAMEAYKNIDPIDIAIKLPNGLQIFTVKVKKK